MTEVEFWTVGEIVREEVGGGPPDDTSGLAVFTGTEEGTGDVVCYLHDDSGARFDNLPNAERNAALIAATPTIYNTLIRLTNMFRPVAHHLGDEYSSELAHAEAVIRSVLSEEEHQADIERVMAEFAGELQ